MNPRSPVRRKGPSPVSFRKARKVASLDFRLPPIALRDARPVNPNFADLAGPAPHQPLGIGDGDLLVGKVLAAADEPAAAFDEHRAVGSPDDLHGAAVGEGMGIEAAHHRRPADIAAGDDQRGLGQAVARIKRLAAETAGREGFGEAVERFRPDRLGAVEGHFPTAQVERLPLFGGDFSARTSRRRSSDRRWSCRRSAKSPTASETAFAGTSSATSARWDAPRRAAAKCRRSDPCRGSWAARTRPGCSRVCSKAWAINAELCTKLA